MSVDLSLFACCNDFDLTVVLFSLRRNCILYENICVSRTVDDKTLEIQLVLNISVTFVNQ